MVFDPSKIYLEDVKLIAIENLTLESTKSQWQTPPWLVEWLGSPPWLSSLAKCTNRTPKTAHGPFKTRGLLKKLRWASFSHRPASFCRVFPKTREFFQKLASFSQKLAKNSSKTRPSFSPKTRQKLVFSKNS
jgi:hypothetical protein